MPLPKEHPAHPNNRRPPTPKTKKKTLADLVKAFGSAESFRATVSAIELLSSQRGITPDAAADLLRETRTQIKQGRQRLRQATLTGGISVQEATELLSAPRKRVGKQMVRQAGGALPAGVVSLVVETAPGSRVLGRGQRNRYLLGINDPRKPRRKPRGGFGRRGRQGLRY